MLYDYFRASDAASAITLAPDGMVTGADLVDAKWVEPVVTLGRLVALARSTEWTVDLVEEELIWPTTDEEESDAWISELSDATRDALADIPDEGVPDLAASWATIEEWGGRADGAYLRDVLSDLIGLARRARTAGDHLYVWSCL